MCILSYVKQIDGPGLIQETGCSGLVHWDDPGDGMGREVGGGFWMGNRFAIVTDSCQCLAKTTTVGNISGRRSLFLERDVVW